jgi:tetratricopeptide (TPR) repeat protein
VNTFSPSPDDPADSIRVLLAEGRFAEALDEFRRLEGRPVPPDLQLMAATAATRLGDLGLGAALAEASLERFRARADDDGRMRAQNLLGVIEFERGNLDRSRQCFTEALGLARALKDTLMTARACNNLASIADLQGDAPGALTLYRSSLLSYQRLGDRRGTAEAYHNLGIVFRQLGEWRDAESAANQAVRHAESLVEKSLLGIAVMGRAEIDLHRGELDMARQQLAWAGSLAAESRDELGILEVELLCAQVALADGKWESAASQAEKARAAAIDARAAVLQAQCAAVSARAFRALGHSGLAEERRSEAARLFQAQGASRRLRELEEAWHEE